MQFAEEDPASPDGSKVHPYFERDKGGRTRDDPYYDLPGHEFVLDDVESSKAYDEYDRDTKARALPFVVEVLHPNVCLPIGVDPKSGKVDAMLIRTQRSVRSLEGAGLRLGPDRRGRRRPATSTRRPTRVRSWAAASR